MPTDDQVRVLPGGAVPQPAVRLLIQEGQRGAAPVASSNAAPPSAPAAPPPGAAGSSTGAQRS